MDNQNKEILKAYQEKNEKSYNFLTRGVEIIKTLLNRNFESYIIGSAVRNFYINKPIDLIEIVTSASNDELKLVFPSLVIDQRGISYLKDSNGYFYFTQFDDDLDSISKKHAEKYYNKKLTKVLQNKFFTVNSLALSPNFQITNIFGGLADLDEMLLKTIDKPKSLFTKSPIAILDALELVAIYGFEFDKKTLKVMAKHCAHLEDIKDQVFIKKMRTMFKGEYGDEATNIIVKNKIFRFVHIYDMYIKKIYSEYKELTFLEKMTILYLLFGKIPDASSIEVTELQELTENITITQLVATDTITAMMVYNIGVDKLLSANKIALMYKHNYVSQEKQIKKLNKKAVISNVRQLNFTNLELIKMFDGDRSIKIKIIMNLLLEKVINGEIINHNTILKEEAKKINAEIEAIFNYQEPILTVEYTDEMINELVEKYQKEFNFLVKVYLNDEKELYNLTALERDEVQNNAKRHAKEFLLATSQYKILEQRGLI